MSKEQKLSGWGEKVSKGEANYGFFNALDGKVQEGMQEGSLEAFRRWMPPLTFETYEEGVAFLVDGAASVWVLRDGWDNGEEVAVWDHVNRKDWGGESLVLRRLSAEEGAWSQRYDEEMAKGERTGLGQVVSDGKVLNVYVSEE